MEEFHSAPRRGYTKKQAWGMLALGIVCAIACVMLAATPIILKSSKKAPMSTATNNAKQIYLLLYEFDQDFGAFPNDDTAAANGALNGYVGAYSNDYLGQLIAASYVNSEEIFYARHGSDTDYRPDNDFSTKAKTLEAGECGFAYIKGLNTKSDLKTPILMAPMYGDGYKFNTDAYRGKCVALRVDGAVKQYRIDKTHHARIGGGKTLFEGGEDTVWGERGFDSSNLCYAKYPYDFVAKTTRWKRVLLWGGAVVLIGLVTLWVFDARRKWKRKKIWTKSQLDAERAKHES